MTGWEIFRAFGNSAAAVAEIFMFAFNKVSNRSGWRGEVDSDRRMFKAFMQEVRAGLRAIRSDIERILERLASCNSDDQQQHTPNGVGESNLKDRSGKEEICAGHALN